MPAFDGRAVRVRPKAVGKSAFCTLTRAIVPSPKCNQHLPARIRPLPRNPALIHNPGAAVPPPAARPPFEPCFERHLPVGHPPLNSAPTTHTTHSTAPLDKVVVVGLQDVGGDTPDAVAKDHLVGRELLLQPRVHKLRGLRRKRDHQKGLLPPNLPPFSCLYPTKHGGALLHTRGAATSTPRREGDTCSTPSHRPSHLLSLPKPEHIPNSHEISVTAVAVRNGVILIICNT